MSRDRSNGWAKRAANMNRKALERGLPGRVAQTDLHAVVAVYGEACFYCGLELDFEAGEGTFDHLKPLGRGGSNTKRNLVPCCLPCNGRKGSKRVAYRGGRLRFEHATA